MFLTTK